MESESPEIEKKLQEIRKALEPVIRERSYKENHETLFTLASGKKSPYYFDLKQTLMDPVCLALASRGLYYLMLQQLKSMPKGAGGLTMGADPLVYSVSLLSVEVGSIIYPYIVRKQVKDHGSKKRVEGRLDELSDSDQVVLIDDVITTGGSTLDACRAMREIGMQIDSAFCILDRKEGGAQNLKNEGIHLYPLFVLEDFAQK